MKPLTPLEERVLEYLKSIKPTTQHKCEIKRALNLQMAPQQALVNLNNHGLITFHPVPPGRRARWSYKEQT